MLYPYQTAEEHRAPLRERALLRQPAGLLALELGCTINDLFTAAPSLLYQEGTKGLLLLYRDSACDTSYLEEECRELMACLSSHWETALYGTAPGGETFTSQLPLVLPVRMQGVLGIANTSGEPSVYWQGVMDRDGTAFTDDVPSGAPYTDRPAYAGAKLYLYSRGSAATFDGLSVSGVTVKGGADATEYVLRPMPVSNDEDTSVLHPDVFRAENDDFRVTVGTPAKDTTSAFTYRPLTVKGRSQGQITLTVTLTDTEGHAFTLSIPYTLTEEDTRVTATLWVDGQALPLSVPYGSAPSVEALRQLLADHNIPEAGISWTPDITQPLYADTAFTAVPKTTDSGGAPTVPDADIPASGSKDPEGTPSDDPSAPDSSSGTDPTPEPSPDTLP